MIYDGPDGSELHATGYSSKSFQETQKQFAQFRGYFTQLEKINSRDPKII